MSLADIIRKPLQRLNPHRGLVIDVPTWSAAHDYHRLQQRLHALSMHGPGVITGLEVTSWSEPDHSVVVHPGVAMDDDGNIIILGEAQRIYLQIQDAGTTYLVLRYNEAPYEMTNTSGGEEPQATYTLEGYALEQRDQLPDDIFLELARIDVSGPEATVYGAENLYEPGLDQIDMRYRMISGPRPLGQVNIGVIPLETTSEGAVYHLPGVIGLVRAINGATKYRAEFKGLIDLNQEVRDCHILFTAGHQGFGPDEARDQVLLNFLERGGVLVGEACGANLSGADAAAPFQQSFALLAERLGRRLGTVARGNNLLNAYFLFAEPPEGIDGPSHLVEGNGIIYSTGDYGCLWDGGRANAPASRESIRSAMEMGINLGVYSSERGHRHSVTLVAQ